MNHRLLQDEAVSCNAVGGFLSKPPKRVVKLFGTDTESMINMWFKGCGKGELFYCRFVLIHMKLKCPLLSDGSH